MKITTLQGDNTILLPTLAAQSIQALVTSPPYYGLRDYEIPPTSWPEVTYAPMPGLPPITIPAQTCCLGLEADPLAYVGHLLHVFRLARPALRNDGTLWLNLGDSYAASGKSGLNEGWAARAAEYRGGGHKAEPSRERSKKSIPPGLKPKDMIGIPWRVAYALQADGWYLRSDIIWHKPNPMPDSTEDRPTKAHEYLFLFGKGPRYYYDAQAVAEPATMKPQRRLTQQEPRYDGPKIGTWKEPRLLRAEPQVDGDGTRNRRTVWTITTRAYHGAHFAVFPEALVEPCIKAGSRPADTILDPYGGSGTTGRVAERLGRDAILMELNPAYLTLQQERLASIQQELLL